MESLCSFLLALLVLVTRGSGFVLDLHYSQSRLVTMDDTPVLVELYYESLCPGCRNFISTMIYPTFDKLRDTGIVKFGLYPYGNAVETENKDGSWNITCQHGPEECLGNLLEVCLMHYLSWDPDLYVPVISCMESADDPVMSAEGCINQLSTASYEAVKGCAKGPEGNRLAHAMGAKTESLDPPHNYVPWVVVDGEHNNEIQQAAMDNLLALVCKLYKGTKPTQCDDSEYFPRGAGTNHIELSYKQSV